MVKSMESSKEVQKVWIQNTGRYIKSTTFKMELSMTIDGIYKLLNVTTKSFI